MQGQHLPLNLLAAFFFMGLRCHAQANETKPLVLGSRTNQPDEGTIQGMPGSQFALWMPNPKKAVLRNIRSASFYIGEGGSPTQPFRVHIYQANNNGIGPGPDLLPQRVVTAAPQGGHWYTVNLSSYSIAAPQEGFFVAMEWLPAAKAEGQSGSDDGMTYQELRPTFEFKESNTWSYTVGKGWRLLTLGNSQGRRYNAKMKAEVDALK